MKSLKIKKPYEIGRFFEKKAIEYLQEHGFKNISWISKKKPTSHFDITAKKDNTLFYIEVRYIKNKKFQITEKKLKALKKLGNVLFLLISPKKKVLLPLKDIEKEEIVSVNKGAINSLEIKKRKLKGNKKSLLFQFLNSPRIKIFDFLLDNKSLDFSKEEIARGVGLSKVSFYKYWSELEKHGIVRVTRKFGKTKLYTLNVKSPITKRILDLEKVLIAEALEKETRKKEVVIHT